MDELDERDLELILPQQIRKMDNKSKSYLATLLNEPDYPPHANITPDRYADFWGVHLKEAQTIIENLHRLKFLVKENNKYGMHSVVKMICNKDLGQLRQHMRIKHISYKESRDYVDKLVKSMNNRYKEYLLSLENLPAYPPSTSTLGLFEICFKSGNEKAREILDLFTKYKLLIHFKDNYSKEDRWGLPIIVKEKILSLLGK